jgi:hypothetical protein
VEQAPERAIQLALLEGHLMALDDLLVGLNDLMVALAGRREAVQAQIHELAPNHDHGDIDEH